MRLISNWPPSIVLLLYWSSLPFHIMDLLNQSLVKTVRSRNYARCSFSQWMLSITRNYARCSSSQWMLSMTRNYARCSFSQWMLSMTRYYARCSFSQWMLSMTRTWIQDPESNTLALSYPTIPLVWPIYDPYVSLLILQSPRTVEIN